MSVDRPDSGSDSRLVLLTFLIADVRGYTSFVVEQGNAAAANLASAFAAIADEVVTARGGEVIELRGDEALAVFTSSPQALRAAVELQHRFAEQATIDPALPLKVGIGIATGEVVPLNGGYRGLALNLAARLCSLAGPGEVYGSEGVIQLAQRLDGLAYVERGRVLLKGFADPIRVIQILSEDQLPTGFPPLVSLVAKPSNLPLQTTPFIGREREISEVAVLLRREEVRLVTLTGTGGTGKTRLALQVGGAVLEEFERGVFVVSLASVNDPNLILSTIAGTLKVKEHPTEPLLDILQEYLHDKQMLLVLDNFEHLLDGALVVAQLLATSPGLKVLVTSRAVLHLLGEHDYPVPPLSVPDPMHLPSLEALSQYEAVALFIERAREVKHGFILTNENAPAVAEVCYRLDGLPLALELAAARARLLPPPALLARLSSRLTLLTGGTRDAPGRQQTLRATIDWSYRMLDEGEQRLFARLSVFQGGCTLEAAEALSSGRGGAELDVLDRAASLVEKSLLRQEGDDEPRFLMLETIREYATEKLAERRETEVIRRHHAEYFLAMAVEAEPHLEGGDQTQWLDQLDQEHDNLRAALRWCLEGGDVGAGLRMAAALWLFWLMRSHLTEGRELLAELLAAPSSSTDDAVRAKALNTAAALARYQGDFVATVAYATESLTVARDLGDRPLVADALSNLGYAAMYEGDCRLARLRYEEGLAINRALGNQQGVADALSHLGSIAMHQEDYATARTLHQESLAIWHGLQDGLGVAYALYKLGQVSLRTGERATARERFRESLAMHGRLGDWWGIADALEGLAAVAAAHPISTLRLAGAAAALRDVVGSALPLAERADFERRIQRAWQEVGDSAAAAAWAEGRAMTPEEASEYALQTVER